MECLHLLFHDTVNSSQHQEGLLLSGEELTPAFQPQGFCFTLTFGMRASARQEEGICLILFIRAINTTSHCLCLCPLTAVLWCVCHRPSIVAGLIKLLSFTFFSWFPWLLPACLFLRVNFSCRDVGFYWDRVTATVNVASERRQVFLPRGCSALAPKLSCGVTHFS